MTLFGQERTALLATGADFTLDRKAWLEDFRMAHQCDKARVLLSSHHRRLLMLWAFNVPWIMPSQMFNPNVAADLFARASPFLLADPIDFVNTDPEFVNIRADLVRQQALLEADAAASAVTRFSLPFAHGRIQHHLTLIDRYFIARARTVRKFRTRPADAPFYREGTLIAHAMEYQATSLRPYLDWLQRNINHAGAAAADGLGTPYTNASWATIFRAFYGAVLRVPSIGPTAEKMVAAALALSVAPSVPAMGAASDAVASVQLGAAGSSRTLAVSTVTGAAHGAPMYSTLVVPAQATIQATPSSFSATPWSAPSPSDFGVETAAASLGPRGQRGRTFQLASPPVRNALFIPSSADIIGDLSPYRHEPALRMPCYECGRVGHLAGECPSRYFRVLRFPLPGFRSDGSRDPGAWTGNIPSVAARDGLLQLFRAHRIPAYPPAPVSLEVFERGIPPPPARRIRGGPWP